MEQRHKEIILAMAENDMHATAAAVALNYHRNTIMYHLEQISKLYGLNPRCFYDLCRLVDMAKEG